MNITDFNDLTLAVNRVRNLAVVIMLLLWQAVKPSPNKKPNYFFIPP